MKRSIFLAAVALMLFQSCSQDEVMLENATTDSAIGFMTHVDNSSKAVTDITLNNMSQFRVWAAKTRNASTTTMLTPIMTNQLVQKQAGLWTYSPLRYWIKNNAYLFNAFACNPASSTQYYTYNLPASVNGGAFSNYYQGTLEYNNGVDGANGNTDLVWANKGVSTVTDANPAPEVVRFTFGHLLCKVNFKFVNEFTPEGESLSVYDVKLENAAKGVMNMDAIPTGTAVPAMTWNPGDTKCQTAYNFGSAGSNSKVSVLSGATASTEYKTIIPNQNSMVVSFKVKTNVMVEEEEYINIVSTIDPVHLLNNELGFQCGYSYTLIAHLNDKTLGNLSPILFDVVKVEDFVQNNTNSEGELLVDLTPTEYTICTSSSKSLDISVANVKAKDLVYLGEFDPSAYSYEWTITGAASNVTSLKFSTGESDTKTIPLGSCHKTSDIKVTVEGTSYEYKTTSESYTVKLTIKDKNGVVVGSDKSTIYVCYPATGGSQDGNDNDG